MSDSAFPGLSLGVQELRASEIRELLKLIARPEIISFAGGIPDPAIFPLDAIIRYISQVMTLMPGDLIPTGTPQGVGPVVASDLMEVTVEGIGTLINPVIDD